MKECEVCKTPVHHTNTTGLCRRCYWREWAREHRGHKREYVTLDEVQKAKVKRDLQTKTVKAVCKQWLISKSQAYKLRGA
jgi:hypothetical protein